MAIRPLEPANGNEVRLEATSRLHPAARLEKERKAVRSRGGGGSSRIKERKKRESLELWILYARGANRGWLHGGEGRLAARVREE